MVNLFQYNTTPRNIGDYYKDNTNKISHFIDTILQLKILKENQLS